MEMEKCNTPAINGSKIEVAKQKLFTAIRTRSEGISNKDLSAEIPDLKPQEQVKIINKLLSEGHIEIFKQRGSLVYRYKDSTKVQGSTNEDKIVYSIIEDAGNKGIWIGDIRRKTNLSQVQLQKILKSLAAKKITKVIKSSTNKLMHMLFHLDPNESVRDSVWFDNEKNNDIDMEFINVLSEQCYRFLEQKVENMQNCNNGPIAARNATYASSEEICKFILNLGISKEQLSVKAIEKILDVLIYDGKIEKVLRADGTVYKSIRPLVNTPGLMRTPCGICPIRIKCCDERHIEIKIITALKCMYLKEWLNSF